MILRSAGKGENGMEDSDIIAAYFRRDENAITETKNKYGAHLYNLAFNMVKNREDAEECESDTYVKAWNSIPPTKPVHFCAWLVRVTRNLCLNRIGEKKQGRRNAETVSLSEELEECLVSPDGVERSLDDATAARVIDGYLDACDRISRFAFVRRYFFGDDYGQIAHYTGKSKAAIRMLLYRMRGELRELLIKEGLGE